jgi:type IV pilus assembly protein PilV
MANRPLRQAGFSLVEILVTLVIVMIGLLGLAGVQMRAHQAELESYQRAQALVLVSDMVDRINANRKVADCYAVTTYNNGQVLGTDNNNPLVCDKGLIYQNDVAIADLTAWDNMLKGAAEKVDATNVGAMVGARGCITWDAALGMYRVSVAWQGIGRTAAPNDDTLPNADLKATCGQGLYGDEKLRREVSANVRMATLK